MPKATPLLNASKEARKNAGRVPPIRHELVGHCKQQIAANVYEDPRKLEIAIDHMLLRLRAA